MSLCFETSDRLLRLSQPWSVEYRDVKHPRSTKKEKLQSANDVIPVQAEGTYEITAVCSSGVIRDIYRLTISTRFMMRSVLELC